MRKLALLLIGLVLCAAGAAAPLENLATLLADKPAQQPSTPAPPAPDLFTTLANGLRDTQPQQAPAKPAPSEDRFLLEYLTQGLAEKLTDPVQLLLEDHRGAEREAAVSSVTDPATHKTTNLVNGKRYDFVLGIASTKQLRFGNMLVNKTTRIKFEEITIGQFANAVAIDLTGLDFANATYAAVARKETLMKCKLWNFTAQRCDGTWEKLTGLAPGTPYEVALTADDPALAETGGIFFDGFEAGLAFNNWTINGTGAKWTNSTLNPYNGTRHANANLLSSGLPTSLIVNVSTKNFTSIRVSYARKLVGLDNTDEFRARWYDGTAWQVLEQTGSASANEANYSVRNFTLPASADDNTKFVLEFSCEANLNSEHCRIDDVRINGTPKIDEAVTLTKTGTPNPVQNGSLLNYTLLVNVSAGTASNTSLTDVYPAQVVFVSASPAPLAGTNNTFIIGNLSNGTTFRINITVRVIVNIANNTHINNTANLTFVNSGGVTRTRTATAQTVVVAPPPPSPCRLLFDSFESGLGPNNWTVNGTGNKWAVSSLNPFNGTQHANANLLSSGLPTSLIVNVNTSNVTGTITVHYARKLVALDGPDEFMALWHNGTAWQVLEQTGSASANEANYSVRNFTLDPTANNKSILLEFMCAANQNAEHCRIDTVCVNWTTDNMPPSVPETNVSSAIPFVGDSVCLLANVTDQSGVQSVTAHILLPNGSKTALPLFDGLTCNSPENDGVFSNHLIVSQEGVHTWTNISVADLLGNAANVSPNRTFEGLLGLQVAANNMPPNLSRYNNGTVISLALINTSNNVYATQSVPSNAQTFMYFNWTLNITGNIANSNVTIEHSYSGTSSMTSILQMWTGASWNNACTLNTSTSDVIDRCDLDGFVNGNASVINRLQLRINTTRGGGGARTQNVDHITLGAENATPGAIAGCPVTINQSTTLEQSVTSGNNCITFGADNVDLDCAGFTIAYNAQGGFGDGILATNRRNITIRNCVIKDANATGANSRGANLDRVNDSSIVNTTISTNGTANNHGILLQSANNIIIDNATVSTQGNESFNVGIYLLTNVSRVNVTRSTIRTAGTMLNVGILLENSARESRIVNNSIAAAGSSADNYGIELATSDANNVIENNTVATNGTSNNHGILLQGSIANTTVTDNTINTRGTSAFNTGIFLSSAVTNATVARNTVRTNGTGSNHGILLQTGVNNNTVTDNTIISGGSNGFNIGVYLVNSSDNNITANRVNTTGLTDNSGVILQSGSAGNAVLGNSISARGTSSSNEGVFLLDLSSNNTIRRNTIVTNGTSNNHGFLLQNQTRGNGISNNTVTASGNGTFNVGMLLHVNADFNVFENNTIKTLGQDANHGFFLDGASDHNNISFNTIAVNGTFSFGIGVENISSIMLINNTVTTNFTEELHLFNTTDSAVLTDIEVGNYSFTNAQVEFRKTGKGKLAFKTKITAKGKSLKEDVVIDDRLVRINLTNTPALNASADITLENANFTDLILDYDPEDDGVFFECPDAICTLLENNPATQQVTFNVTHFSSYRVIRALVHVLKLSPGDGASFLLNETADIRVNATPSSSRLLDKVIVEITLPNGTKLNQSLLNATKDVYNATFPDLVLRGTYNVTFLANDSKNARNTTVKAQFARKALNIVDLQMQQTDLFANDTEENATFTKLTFGSYAITVLSNASGLLNLSIALNESSIVSINVTNHDERSPGSVLKFDDWEHGSKGSFKTFAIDPSAFNFTNITITVNASGETLTKCADWNFTTRDCAGNWTPFLGLSPGQLYAFSLNATDPAFAESSPAIDVGVTPFSNETMVVAWVDNASASVRVAVVQTNGSVFVNDTVIDATADEKSRVDVLTINETHFIVAWIDGPSEALRMFKFAYNGTHILNQSNRTIDPKVGTNTDVSIADIDDRFIVCYANGDDSDADFYIFNKTDSSTIVSELNSDLNMNPGATLQNLVDCAGVNATRWVHAWFDDSPAEDATYDIKNETGIFITGGLDIDNNVGSTGQVAITAVDRDKFAMAWYDGVDQDVSISVQRIDNTEVLAPTDIDSSAGTESRVAITAVRENKTSAEDLLAVTWWNQSSDRIMAAVFRGNGSVYTPPFTVDAQPSAAFRLLDIAGKNPVTNNSICPGRFIVAYSNSTNASVFKGFIVNGSDWDGVCDFVRPINLSPEIRLSLLLNDTVNITANVTSRRMVDYVYVNVTLPNGTIINVRLLNDTKDIYNATFLGENLLQRGVYNITFWANNTKNLAEIANTTFTRRALDVIDLRMRDRDFNESQENESATFLFANYSVALLSNASGVLNLSLTVNGSRILQLNITSHDERSIRSIIDVDDWESAATGSFISYGTDPARLNFTNSTLLANASGTVLSKCADWNFTARDCGGNWTVLKDIVRGQTYALSLTPDDPGLSESSPAIDIGASAIGNESVVLAWVDNASASVRFAVYNTNGSVIVNDTVIDATADNKSRVDLRALNHTRFVIAWVDGPSNALRKTTYAFNGTVATNVSNSTVDAAVGTNADVSVAQIGDRYIACYANDDDNDADFHMFSKSDDSDLVGELNADLNMNPGATLQNLFDCAGINGTRWVPFWFDDSPSEDATFDIFNETGVFQTGQTDIDPAVGASAQVAITAVDGDKFAMAWYNGIDQDVAIAIRHINNSVILAPTAIDSAAGAESRVAVTAVGENDTSTADLFAVAWWNQSSNRIMAAVFRGNGSAYTPPFTVSAQPSANFRLLDVTAKDPVTNVSVCPGKFIVAYSNSTNAAAFAGFEVNGSAWDGVCRREGRVAFTLNQTIYHQGTSLIPAANPEFGVKYFVPFQVRFSNAASGTPISTGTCNVTINNTGNIVALTFNSTTGNYTGQLDTFNQFGNNTFNATCAAPGFGIASNATTAQIVLRLYLIGTRNIFYGGDGANLTNTTTWLSKLPPSSSTARNRTYSLTLMPNATNVTIADLFICGSHRPLNCSILKEFTMRGNVTMRINASASSDNTCLLRLCYLIADKALDPVLKICNSFANASTTPSLSEHSVSIDGTTIDSTNFGGFRAICDAAPGVVAETPLNITLYYNYSEEPPNLEITHPGTSEIQSQRLRTQQLEADYVLGPNEFLNATLNITTQFNNTGNETSFVYARVSRNLPEFEPSIIRNTTVVFNSTNQLWASDNASQNATQNVTLFAHDVAQYVTESLPGGNVRNNSQRVKHNNALRSNETFGFNSTADKRWDALIRHIFVKAVAIENVTAFTNYSAFGFAPEDEFGFFVNVTNATGTFDITNDSIVDRTAKTVTFPKQTLANNATFRIKGRDVRGPRVHDESPENQSEFNITDAVRFRNNISDLSNVSVALVNITLPNGTVLQFNLSNITNQTFAANFSELILRGRYNITYVANDSFDNRNDTVRRFFHRKARNIIDIINHSNANINFTIAVGANVSGVLDLNLTVNHTVQRMRIFNHSEASPYGVIRLGGEINEPTFPKGGNFSIDASDFNFSLINVTRVATSGDVLYKCAHFDRATESCVDLCSNVTDEQDCLAQPEGLWVPIANITPGQEYSILITNASDPGFAEFNTSQRDDETNTTSTTPADAIRLNFTPDAGQYLLLGYAELQGASQTSAVRSRLILNDTHIIGNLSWQPDTSRTSHPPGDYQPFFSHELMNLSPNSQNVSVQFFTNNSAAAVFIRRARAIVMRVNNSDAVSNESGDDFQRLTPANAFHSITNLSFTPIENQTVLVLASAEVNGNSTANSIFARLLVNGSEQGRAQVRVDAPADIDLFATHLVMNVSANIMQNFTLQAQSVTTTNKSIRRARITVVPLSEVFYNSSENLTISSETVIQDKTFLHFNLTSDSDAVVIGSAELNISSITNGNFVLARLLVDDEEIGNMTMGASSTTDLFSFVTTRQMGLAEGEHTAQIRFRRIGATSNVSIQRARITVIPVQRVFNLTACPVTINKSINLTQNLSTALNGSTDACIAFGADNIEFDCKGFSITGNRTGRGIEAINRRNVAVRNCIVTNFSDGIFFNNANGSVIAGATVLNNSDDGIDLQDSLFNVLDANNVSSNFDNNLALLRSTGNNITNSTFAHAAGDAFSAGIILFNATHGNRITNTTVLRNQDDGVFIDAQSDNNTFEDDRLIGNGEEGIDIASSSGVAIRNSFFDNNTHDGIEPSDSNFTVIAANTIQNSRNHGIQMTRAHFANVTLNTITNATNCVSLNSSNDNWFANNTLQRCALDGMTLALESANNQVVNNTIQHNGQDGINVAGSGTAILLNTVRNNSDDGIDVNDGNFSRIEQNAVQNSTDNGIVLTRSDFSNITNNTVVNASGAATSFCIELFSESDSNRVMDNAARQCQDDGIVVTEGSNDNALFNNTLERNGDDGIGITDSLRTNATKNLIQHNTDAGIALSGSNSTVLEGNVIVNNTDDGILLITGSSHNIIRANIIANHTNGTNNEGINILSNVADQLNNTIELNNITRVGDDGIQVVNRSFDVILRQNIIMGTGFVQPLGEGILLVGVRNGNVTRNNISDTGNRGIRVSRSYNVTVEHNVLANISALAINIEKSNRTTLINNTIEDDETELQLFETNISDLVDIEADNYTLVNASFRLTKTGKARLEFLRHNITRHGKNFSADIVLSNRSIFVNTTAAPELNVSANVTFFNVNFSDIIIETDAGGSFAECPETICALLENNQTTEQARFNVTGFSQYQVIPAIINVNQISPSTGQEVLLNGSLDIRANATPASSRFLDALFVNVTLPNGTVVLLELLNETKDVYNATLAGTNLLQRGRYNLTFLANDSRDIKNFTVKTHFIRKAFTLIDIVDSPSRKFKGATIAFRNTSGILDLNITPLNHTVQLIQVFNHSENSPFSIIRIDTAINESVFPEESNFTIDASHLNFSLINVTRTATSGNILFKCAHFNLTDQSCIDLCSNLSENNNSLANCPEQPGGLWVPVINITPGQNYSFLLFNATDPGFAEFNTSQREDEINTTSTSPVTAIQANFTPVEGQYVLLGYGELQGSATSTDVRSRLLLNDTLIIGNMSWRPESTPSSNPPGDYQPFFSHKLMNLSRSPQNLSMQFFTASASNPAFIRRARAIDIRVPHGDAYTNDSGDDFQQLDPAGTFHSIANLSYVSPVNQSFMVLATAEILPNSSGRTITARFVVNGTAKEQAVSISAGGSTTDINLFAAHETMLNASANVTRNFSIQASGQTDTFKAIRRARLTVVPLNSGFTNVSEDETSTSSTDELNKTVLFFNLTDPSNVLVIATASTSISKGTNGNFIGANLLLDGVSIGNMTKGATFGNTEYFSFAVAHSTNLSNGTHTAIITIRRAAGTAGTEARIRNARVTIIPIGRADLLVTNESILFNNTNPDEGENITISAVIFNNGTAAAPNVLVEFWDGANETGTFIGNATISPVLLGGENRTVNVTYLSVIGNRTITVVVDPDNDVPESNKTNNIINRTLNVKATTFYTGLLAGNITLESELNITKYNFGFNDSGNVYIFDTDSAFNLSYLQALGRNRTGGNATNDFGDLDFILNSTFFNDSVRKFWGGDTNNTPVAVLTFNISNNTVLDVPVINSTNSSLFVTGILWDVNDDTNGQFDTADNEDVVFVGNINPDRVGGFGQPVDYELRVATLVRRLRPFVNQTAFIVELQ